LPVTLDTDHQPAPMKPSRTTASGTVKAAAQKYPVGTMKPPATSPSAVGVPSMSATRIPTPAAKPPASMSASIMKAAAASPRQAA
jgi:hypothetical protein